MELIFSRQFNAIVDILQKVINISNNFIIEENFEFYSFYSSNYKYNVSLIPLL